MRQGKTVGGAAADGPRSGAGGAQPLQEQISCIAANAAEQKCSCSELDVDALDAKLVQGVPGAQRGPVPPGAGASSTSPASPLSPASPISPASSVIQSSPASSVIQANPPSQPPAQSPGGWLLRLAVPPDRLSELVGDLARNGLSLTGEAGSGLAMAWAEPQQLPSYRVEALRRRTQELGGYLTVLRQPAASAMPAWLDAPSRPLIEAVKRQFDPLQQLARGRLPGVQPKPLAALG